MSFKFSSKGSYKKTEEMLRRGSEGMSKSKAMEIGEKGVKNLKEATPVDSGKTADSWYYELIKNKNSYTVEFHNSNIQNGCLIAILIDTGHASRNGSWVEGEHYISPVIEELYKTSSKQLLNKIVKGA